MIQAIAVLTPLYVCGFWSLVFLNSPSKKNKARHFLGFFMAIAFLLYLGHSLFFIGKFDVYIQYDPVYIASSMLVYPMYYQYIRLLTVDTRWQAKYILHYLPAVFAGSASLILHYRFTQSPQMDIETYFRESYLFSFDQKSQFFWNRILYALQRTVFALQVTIYVIAGYVLIRKYRDRLLNYYTNQENRSMRWVNFVFLSLAGMAFLSLIFNTIGKFAFLHNNQTLLIPSLLFSGMLFILGYLANGQNQIISEIELADENESFITVNPHFRQDQLDMKLRELFEKDKLHLNSDLKIWDITAKLGTNRTYLSNFINKQYRVNFSMLVNRYRVEEAKALLAENEGSLYSLEVIGEKCGFGSYNNFIRVFRELENLTPGRYRDGIKGGHKN